MLQYGKVTSIGNDPAIEGILQGEVIIEEKLDGSQFRIEIQKSGAIAFGSKSVDGTIDKMFNKGIVNATNRITSSQYRPKGDMVIFAEYFQSPKHNTLSYSRVPSENIAVFDVFLDNQWVTDPHIKWQIASFYGFDVVPVIWKGNGQNLTVEIIEELLKKESYLGGTTLEGIVIKNYNKTYDAIRYPYLANYFMRGKRVRKEFQELNRAEWGIKKGHIEGIIESIRTPQRFEKAYQHLRDSGQLQGNMKDLPVLIKEYLNDILTENGEEIKNAVWDEAWRRIRSGAVKGLPEFYKSKLTENLITQEIK